METMSVTSRKAIMAKITNLKKSVPKGDKKRAREVQAEMALLKEQLEQMSTGQPDPPNCSQNDSGELNGADGDKRISWAGTELVSDLANDRLDGNHPPPKVSKAQQRRAKKEQKQKQYLDGISDQEKLNASGVRERERQEIDQKLAKRGLFVFDIPPDGDCLFGAVSHQLSLSNIRRGVEQLRINTVKALRSNRSEFEPFMESTELVSPAVSNSQSCAQEQLAPDGDDRNSTTASLTNDSSANSHHADYFDWYCDRMSQKTVWGGQLEVRALSLALQLPIEVVQSEGPPAVSGQEFLSGSSPLTLVYYRHAFSLGEHYNSTVPLIEDVASDKVYTKF